MICEKTCCKTFTVVVGDLIVVEKEEVAAETPAVVHARQAQEDKDRAYKTLIEDPTVQDLVSVFNATVIPESVKSGNLERKN